MRPHLPPCTSLPNLDFLDAPDAPPALRAFYMDGCLPPASAFSHIAGWCHANDAMPVVRDMQKRRGFTGALHVQASNEPEWLGMSGVSSMLDSLQRHGIRCTELNVQLRNAHHAMALCTYLDSLGQDGPRGLSIDLSAHASDVVVPKELGRCILSMPTLRHLTLRGHLSDDDSSCAKLEDGFFSRAWSNDSIEWLEMDGSFDAELPAGLVRQWLANRALCCIVLGAGSFAATFCGELVNLQGQHAVRDLQLVRWFKGAGQLAPRFICAQPGVLQLTLPPCDEDEDVDEWLCEIAAAVEHNFELQNLAVRQANGTPLPLDETSPTIANGLQRNRRILMAVNTGVNPKVAMATELMRSAQQTLRAYMDDTFSSGVLTLNRLLNFVFGQWGPRLDEWVLEIVLAEARQQFEAAFDAALTTGFADLQNDMLPPGRIGRRALPPDKASPPPKDHMRDYDPWPCLVPLTEMLLALPGIPKPAENFLLFRQEPHLEHFQAIALWCLEANQLDVLLSMQVEYGFAGFLNLASNCPVNMHNDPIPILRQLRKAGIEVGTFAVSVTTQARMDELVEFLESPDMLSTGVRIRVNGANIPSELGRALFGNPRVNDVRLGTAGAAPAGLMWHILPPDFFDRLQTNSTLASLVVEGSFHRGTAMNCQFDEWIRRGAVETIRVPASAWGIQVMQALVSSAGESRVRDFRLTGASMSSSYSPAAAALFDQRLGLISLALPATALEGIVDHPRNQPMLNERLLENHTLRAVYAAQPDRSCTDFNDRMNLIGAVLKRNTKMQRASLQAGIRRTLEAVAEARGMTGNSATAFSQSMAPFVIDAINQGKLIAASLTQLTHGSVVRTREVFEAEMSKDSVGSKVFGNYFKTLFEPDAVIFTLFRQLRTAGAKLTARKDYQALKQSVVGLMMDWLDKALRSSRPEIKDPDEAATSMDIDPGALATDPQAFAPMEADAPATTLKRGREDDGHDASSTKHQRI
ncbi:hypothetical protein GCM10023165_36570 [Variovorax defluvii]|uniref:Uncharacterized protein n=1 Tax=Variovorax defluvii TaxID=913761 RepID=A0ABP8I1X8_9BURK